MGAGSAIVLLLLAIALLVVFALGVALVVGGLVERRRSGGGRGLLVTGAVLAVVAVGIPASLPIIGLLRGDRLLELDARDGRIDLGDLDEPEVGTDDLFDDAPDAVDVRLPGGHRLRTEADGLSVVVGADPDDCTVRSIAIAARAVSRRAAERRARVWLDELGIDAELEETARVDGVSYEASVQAVGDGDRAIPRIRFEW